MNVVGIWGCGLLGTHYLGQREPVHTGEGLGGQMGEESHHRHRRKSRSIVV